MDVGIVAYEMEGQPSGVGRYLEGLLGGVAETDSPWRWHLFFKGEPFEHALWSSGDPRFMARFDGRPAARPILWEQLRLPSLLRRQRLDFLFSPAYSLPPRTRAPQMLTLHDLSFEHLGDEFRWRERWRRRVLARWAARRAQRVLTDTQRVAKDLEHTYGLPTEKIGVVPLAVARRFFTPPSYDLAQLGVRPPYLAAVATLLPRRRIDLLLETFAGLATRQPELQLVLAGRNQLPDPQLLTRLLKKHDLESRVVRIDYVPDEALPALYAGAELSFYLSTYEGYGLPPLESLAAGTAVVVNPGLALDDLWQDYPYRAELDLPSLSEVSARALADPNRPAIARQGRQLLSKLTWKNCAEQWLEEIHRAMTA